MNTRLNPCHSRPPLKKTMLVQDGWRTQAVPGYGKAIYLRVPNMVEIPFRNTEQCQYTFSQEGQKDAGCAGCPWKSPVA